MVKNTIEKKTKVKVSKYMSYLLRHNPKGLKLDGEGFTNLDEFLELIKARFKWLEKNELVSIAKENERYEIKNDKIKAIYGHSVKVSYNLKQLKIDKLYHGTTENAALLILKSGLKPMGRQKVHLSSTIEAAKRVGKRRDNEPTILIIDVSSATKDGIIIEKASDKVYLSDFIPPKYIKILKKEN